MDGRRAEAEDQDEARDQSGETLLRQIGEEEGLELGEGHLDGVEVGTVGRQLEQPDLGGFDGLSDTFDLVGEQLVHDDQTARRERARNLLSKTNPSVGKSPPSSVTATPAASTAPSGAWRRPVADLKRIHQIHPIPEL
jgi:hypothetical protein